MAFVNNTANIKTYQAALENSETKINNIISGYNSCIKSIDNKFNSVNFYNWDDDIATAFKQRIEEVKSNVQTIDISVNNEELQVLKKYITALKDEINDLDLANGKLESARRNLAAAKANDNAEETGESDEAKKQESNISALRSKVNKCNATVDSCVKNINSILTKIKSIDFGQSKDPDNLPVNFEDPTDSQTITSSDRLDELTDIVDLALTSKIGEDLDSDLALFENVTEYQSLLYAMYLNGEISYEEYVEGCDKVNQILCGLSNVYTVNDVDFSHTCDAYLDLMAEQQYFFDRGDKDLIDSVRGTNRDAETIVSEITNNGNSKENQKLVYELAVVVLRDVQSGKMTYEQAFNYMNRYNNQYGDAGGNNGVLDAVNGYAYWKEQNAAQFSWFDSEHSTSVSDSGKNAADLVSGSGN